MCAIDDAEPWGFYAGASRRKARKAHRCCECQREIAAGEFYHYCAGVMDGSWSTWKTCEHCRAAATFLDEECNGHLVGGIFEDLVEHDRYGAEYQSDWLTRAIDGIKAQWRSPDGELLPVLDDYQRVAA